MVHARVSKWTSSFRGAVTRWSSGHFILIPMTTIDAKHKACLEGFIAECARADELGRTAAGLRLLEAQRALEDCNDPVELIAVRHWYHAAWDAYAVSRGWLTSEPVATVAATSFLAA